MGTIVVGVDGSEVSKHALRWALAQAQQTGDDVRVVMVFDDPYREMWVPHVPPSDGDELKLTLLAVRRIVSEVAGDHPKVDIETKAGEGPAAKVLVEESRDASLLVIGNRGRGGFGGVLLGSVSFHCVSHAQCPVVVVRGHTTGHG
jgi:nucleotide-binding universal stress UspA family protein